MLATPFIFAAASALPQTPTFGDVAVIQLSGDDTIEAIGVWTDTVAELGPIADALADVAEELHDEIQGSSPSPALANLVAQYAEELAKWPTASQALVDLGITDLGPTTVTFAAFGVGTAVVDLPGLRFEDLVPAVGLVGLPKDWALHAEMLRIVRGVAVEVRDELLRANESIVNGQPAPYVDPALVHSFDLSWQAGADRARRTAVAARRLTPYIEAMRQLAVSATNGLQPAGPPELLDIEFDGLKDFVGQLAENTRVDGLKVLDGVDLGLVDPGSPTEPDFKLPKLNLTPSSMGIESIGIQTDAAASDALHAIDSALNSVATGAGVMFSAELKALDIAIDSVGGSGASMPGA